MRGEPPSPQALYHSCPHLLGNAMDVEATAPEGWRRGTGCGGGVRVRRPPPLTHSLQSHCFAQTSSSLALVAPPAASLHLFVQERNWHGLASGRPPQIQPLCLHSAHATHRHQSDTMSSSPDSRRPQVAPAPGDAPSSTQPSSPGRVSKPSDSSEVSFGADSLRRESSRKRPLGTPPRRTQAWQGFARKSTQDA